MIGDLRPRLQAALSERYAIERELGRGGTAIVYLARDLRHERRVALKVLLPELAAAIGPERFLREIVIAAGLSHPNILPLFDSGEADGLLYYVMPYVSGRSLRDRIEEEGPLPVLEAVDLTRQVASALSFAHEHAVMHRDIKPGNILLESGRAIVADFGLARSLADAEERLTATGIAMGTPAYMSPEQMTGSRQIDARSDIYSLGCVVYEMLAGDPPFSSRRQHTVAARQLVDPVPPLSTIRPAVPRDLEAAVLRALEKQPADRWPSVAAFAEALTSGLASPAVGSRIQGAPQPWSRRKVAGILAAIGVAVLLWRLWAGLTARGPLDPALFAVLPFRLEGDSAAVSLSRSGIIDLLATRLSGVGGLRAVPTGTMMEAWNHAGGSRGLSRAREERLASDLGAGRVVVGRVATSADRITIDAALLELPGGSELARVEQVSGAAADLEVLLDRVAIELLVRVSGEDLSRLPMLRAVPSEASKAYLAGIANVHRGRYAAAGADFKRAMQSDSTFALAGVAYLQVSLLANDLAAAGEGADMALAHRDRLAPRDDRFLVSLVNPESSQPTDYATLLRAWNRVVDSAPGMWEATWTLADNLFAWGAASGNPLARQQAANLFTQLLVSDSGMAPALERLIDIRASLGDTAGVRLAAERHARFNPAADERTYVRWRAAVARNDSAAAHDLLGRMDTIPEPVLYRIVAVSQLDGVALDQGTAAASELLKRAKTQYSVWTATEAGRSLAINMGAPSRGPPRPTTPTFTVPIEDLADVISAIYWDLDTATGARIADQAQAVVAGASPAALPAEDPRFMHACSAGLWHASRGRWDAVERASRFLARAQDPRGQGMTMYIAICRAILEAERAAGLSLPSATTLRERLDSIIAPRPATNAYILLAATLTVVRLRAVAGDRAGALAAARRRPFTPDSWSTVGLSTLLEEEGQLAMDLGDRDAAVEAFSHYLRLRQSPDPALRGRVERVRTSLAALVAERPQ